MKLGEKRGIKLGEKRGIKLGEERGIKLGEERGIKLGEERREADRKETAMFLKSQGLPIDVIAEATKLTPDEIERMESPQVKNRAATRKPSRR